MTSFDSTKAALKDILEEIKLGKIQLPDFQRGWVWDDDHIRDLLVSLAKSFPVGAVMLLETGGEVRFQTRPVEGLEKTIPPNVEPERLILDGQQRLTTLTQALKITEPVNTRTAKGKKINRHYYFDIRAALDSPYDLESAVVAVDENRQLRTNFGRDVALDLSTRELECQQMHFPCDQMMVSDEWEQVLIKQAPDDFATYMKFREAIVIPIREYQVPIIQMKKNTTKEAVCLVFEKVNTGGVQLSVFELITASYAADGYNLRDDWFGSRERNVESRRERLESDPLLKGIKSPDFLQAVTLLATHERKKEDIAQGKTGKQVRPIAVKRSEVLQLPLSAWQQWADTVERGFMLAAKFLRKEYFYARREVPYATQLVPLAAVLARLGERWLEPRIHNKLARWFWSGALGELYGGAVESRMAVDYEELLEWFDNDEATPRTVRDASFQPDRLSTLRSRISAAYKAVNVLVLREGAQDWFWKAGIQELDANELALDIHHIFPRKWCQTENISRDDYDSILNKTPISYKANRKIGGDAPSAYLPKIQNADQVKLNDDEMNSLLESHALSPELLRADNFSEFIEDRRKRVCDLVAKAMGKPVSQVAEAEEYEDVREAEV